jgi:hypothetical protein
VECSNYGCGEAFDPKENRRCRGHRGRWDFGHTGGNIEESLKASFRPLWEAHWTCCGKRWDEACASFHGHEFEEGRARIDLHDTFNQAMFRKNVRSKWSSQIKGFERYSEKELRARVAGFAARHNF